MDLCIYFILYLFLYFIYSCISYLADIYNLILKGTNCSKMDFILVTKRAVIILPYVKFKSAVDIQGLDLFLMVIVFSAVPDVFWISIVGLIFLKI